MYHIQVPKKTAPIQLSKPKIQTIGTTASQEIRGDQKTPPELKFISIFTLPWGDSELLSQSIQANQKVNPQYVTSSPVQRMANGSEAEDKDKTNSFGRRSSFGCRRHGNVVGENHRESNSRRED